MTETYLRIATFLPISIELNKFDTDSVNIIQDGAGTDDPVCVTIHRLQVNAVIEALREFLSDESAV